MSSGLGIPCDRARLRVVLSAGLNIQLVFYAFYDAITRRVDNEPPPARRGSAPSRVASNIKPSTRTGGGEGDAPLLEAFALRREGASTALHARLNEAEEAVIGVGIEQRDGRLGRVGH